LWNTTLEEIQGAHVAKGPKNDSSEIPEEIRKQLKEKGIGISEGGSFSKGFGLLFSVKQGLRAPTGIYCLFDIKVREVILRSSGGKLANGSGQRSNFD
jgi:hypothetical protein